jgi:excisionase family DNA binding protein
MQRPEILVPTDAERESARDSSRLLSRSGTELHVRGAVETEFDLRVPERIAKMFQFILFQLAQGKGITIIPNEALLTTQDAADLLHVSRPFLIKLLYERKVQIQKVGNRRKISFEEVKKLKESLETESRNALTELAKMDSELGIE